MMKPICYLLPFAGLFFGACATRTSAPAGKPFLPSDRSVPTVAAVFGPSNPTAAEAAAHPIKYYASVVALSPAMEAKYRELHANVWPEVVAAIRDAHIRNYHIFVGTVGGRRLLFSFFEYTGTNASADFRSIAENKVTRDQWWPITDACQVRLPGTLESAQWMDLEPVMFLP